jgi:hypothetical protein
MQKILLTKFPNNPTAIQHFGGLLVEYKNSGFAPPNLKSELAAQDDKGRKFWSHVWEAILYRHLKLLNLIFVESKVKKSGQCGPDFGVIHSGKVIWIDAVVPEPIGIPEDYLKPPAYNPAMPEARVELHEQKLLRWTAVIKEKQEKFSSYIRDGVVSENDCAIIAVNSCCLQDFAFDDLGISQLPYAVEATFPIGPIAIPLNRQGQQVAPAQNLWRSSLLNKNGAQVRTDNFFDDKYKHISAVMGAHQRDMFNNQLHLSLAHNPLAVNPLPKRIMSATNEFVCELSETEFALRSLSDEGEAVR